MKNFRTLVQAKKDIDTLQKQIEQIEQYIALIKNYKPQTFTQHVIHEYALDGNLKRTAEVLNTLGLQIDGRSIESKDISAIIKSRPDPNDLLHKEVRRLFSRKTLIRKS